MEMFFKLEIDKENSITILMKLYVYVESPLLSKQHMATLFIWILYFRDKIVDVTLILKFKQWYISREKNIKI